MLKPGARCPCGSGLLVGRCCLPALRRRAWPATAEALMRSRYTAFALGDFAWLRDSHHPETRHSFDEADTRQWNATNHWLQLRILEVDAGGPTHAVGRVRFEAVVRRGDGDHLLAEDSVFSRHEGRWYYVGTSSGDPSSSGSSTVSSV